MRARDQLEESILAACLLNPAALDQAYERLTPDHFTIGTNRSMYTTMLTMYAEGEPVDLTTILTHHHSNERVRILEISEAHAVVSNTSQYVGELIEHNAADKLTHILREGQRMLASPKEYTRARDYIETEVYRLGDGHKDTDTEDASGFDLATDLSEWYEDKHYTTKIPSGFRRLDRVYGGFEKGRLICVTGHSKDGKSLVMNQMADAAAAHGMRGWTVSLEMPKMEVMQRWAAQLGVNYKQLLDKDPSAAAKLTEAFVRFRDYQWRVTGRVITPAQVRMQQIRHKYDVIVYDHLHRLTSDREELEDAVRQLKNIALDLDCLVITGAQLSRRDDERGEPNINMLRGTQIIEQECDMVLSIWRHRSEHGERQNEARLRVLACRFGPADAHLDLNFNAQHMRFQEPALTTTNIY